MKTSFNEWFENHTRHPDEDGRSLYVYITGDEAGAAVALIQFEAGFMLETADGDYEVIVGTEEFSSRSLEEAARFLWDNHSKYEVAAKGN